LSKFCQGNVLYFRNRRQGIQTSKTKIKLRAIISKKGKEIMTNREAFEECAGMNLCPEFFLLNGIDPDAEYKEEQQADHNLELTVTEDSLWKL